MQGILKRKKKKVKSHEVFHGGSLTLSLLMRFKCKARQITPVSVVTHLEYVLVDDGLYHKCFAYHIQKSDA